MKQGDDTIVGLIIICMIVAAFAWVLDAFDSKKEEPKPVPLHVKSDFTETKMPITWSNGESGSIDILTDTKTGCQYLELTGGPVLRQNSCKTGNRK